MRKVYAIARRDYLATVAAKGFVIGLIMLPLLIGAAHSLLHLFNGVLNGPPAKQTVSFE